MTANMSPPGLCQQTSLKKKRITTANNNLNYFQHENLSGPGNRAKGAVVTRCEANGCARNLYEKTNHIIATKHNVCDAVHHGTKTAPATSLPEPRLGHFQTGVEGEVKKQNE